MAALFVTGASKGVGAAIARRFAGEGWRVACASRSGTDLGLEGALGLTCDVSDAGQVESAVATAVGELGGLDAVIANAGVGSYGPFLDIPPDEVEAMIDVNLKGTLYTARYTLPHLIESKGDFISLASVAGLRGFPGETVYNASKFGQLGFTRSLDHEMREKGVRVTNLCPGGIATEFAMGTGRTPEMPELEGMMSPEEVADVAWFVVSRPKGLRMMTVSFRPMNEGSWG
ncbi:MAG: SDR family oxidoreductase [Thermoleophilaceae bacterium]|nr:SDR family oxidoreductase [Thermoleophilaceae bacterium]